MSYPNTSSSRPGQPVDSLQLTTSGAPLWRGPVRFAAVLGLAALAWSCVLFVDETEYVIVETLGQITAVYDNVDERTSDRGLHFKLPWPIGVVRSFDRRQQLFDPPGREMFTRDKKNVTISSYLCWKIADLPASTNVPISERPVVKFFRRLGNVATAEARLDARLRSIVSTEVGHVELSELIKVKHSEAGPQGDSPVAAVAESALKKFRQRPDETEDLQTKMGIEVIDLRIKRINLPEGNRFAVYERMRTERERIAERYRSAGQAEKTRIESQARRQSAELLAKAEADAERIRGEGEAEAIGILNRAHAEDPEFYEFQRTLATYSRILNDRTTLVLSASSRLFRLLTDGVPPPVTPGVSAAIPGTAKTDAAKTGAAKPETSTGPDNTAAPAVNRPDSEPVKVGGGA